MKIGFLAPYKGERYHIPDFQRGSQLHCPEERFNYLNSSLRSVIERTFGVWKNRWKILRCMPAFNICTQNYIIVATMVIHNFIRAHDHNDIPHSRFAWGTYRGSEGGHYDGVADVVFYLDLDEMKEVRNNIITSICMDHNWWFTNFNVIQFCIMVLFLLSSRTNSSQNLIVKPSILSLLYIVTCETYQYCNNRFLGYKGLLNRVQSNLNITINSMDFKIATVNYEEFIQTKKKKNTKSALNFF